MECLACKAPISSDDQFCTECGAAASAPATTLATAPAVPCTAATLGGGLGSRCPASATISNTVVSVGATRWIPSNATWTD